MAARLNRLAAIKASEQNTAPVIRDDTPFSFSADPLQAEIERKVAKVFDVFDSNRQKVVDVREVGTMVRALDLCPTEAEVQEIIGAVEEPSTRGVVKFSAFVSFDWTWVHMNHEQTLPRHVTSVIMEGQKYQQYSKEELMRFFLKLDKEKKGTIDPSKLRDVIYREGEPFTLEEADEMINFAVNKDDGHIHYEEYVEKTIAALRTKNI